MIFLSRKQRKKSRERYTNALIDLVLSHPPELPLMAKNAKHFDAIRETDFFKKMAFWVFPGIDSSSFALQTFQLLIQYFFSNELHETVIDFVQKKQKALQTFVAGLFDDRTGGFFQTGRNRIPTLHAVHCVIALVKAFYALKDREHVDFESPVGKEKVRAFFASEETPLIERDVVESVLQFTASCFDSHEGGFREVPSDMAQRLNLCRAPSITATSSAVWAFRQLEENLDSFLSSKQNRASQIIVDFARRHQSDLGNLLGFRNTLDDKEPLVCTTYYTERLFRNLGVELEPEEIKRLLGFLFSNKQRGAGFSAKKNLEANIIHTKNALSVISRYYSHAEYFGAASRRERSKFFREITEFVRDTGVKGGYAVGKRKRYLPSMYGTRMALDIYRYVSFLVETLGIEKASFEFLNPDETIEFILCCYQENEGAFRGFPTSKEYVTRDYLTGFFGRAAA